MEDKLFDLMTKMYNEMQGMKSEMQDMKQSINTIDSRLDTIESKLDEKADKKDIALLEHKILDKINALFDAREVQIDRETEMARDIKQVQGTVEKIELKIIKNS